MYPTTYGRGRLTFYNDLSGKALERLTEVLSDMAADRHSGRFDKRAQTLVEEAIRQKFARMRLVFPRRSLPDETKGSFAPTASVRQICLVTAYEIDGVQSLADDNELDIPCPDGNGRVHRLGEIIAESILDDAVLTGRLIEIHRL